MRRASSSSRAARALATGTTIRAAGYPGGAGRARAKRVTPLCDDRSMERIGPLVKVLLAFGVGLHLQLHIHHHIKGAPVDYVGLALAAAASWIGVPGPGEP